jgi:hypothetical protein
LYLIHVHYLLQRRDALVIRVASAPGSRSRCGPGESYRAGPAII